MSERFFGSIIFPSTLKGVSLKDIPEIRDYLERADEVKYLDDGTINAKEYEANYGVPEIEEALVRLGVAFDRYSESYTEYNAEWRFFRPSPDDVDTTVTSDQNGKILISLEELEKIEKELATAGKSGVTVKDVKEKMGIVIPVAEWLTTNEGKATDEITHE